jgi:hypothetical protein
MFNRYKIFAAYLIAIPLALILGFLSASPDELTFMLLGMLLFFLALPLFIKWHHALLIVFWNSIFNAAFLPGRPDFWLFFAALSFGISFLNHLMFQKRFLHAPELTRPLLFLAAVVLGTAWCRGGIGIRSLGGATYGGRYYIFVLGAILGYFAFTAEPVPIFKSRKLAGLFFLSGTTNALGNLAYMLGPAFYIFYYIVPSGHAVNQAIAESMSSNMIRITGLGAASFASLCFLLLNYGIRGLFDWAKPWRFVFLCLTIVAAGLSGFRTTMAMVLLLFAIQFYFEGLLRTRLFPVMVGLAMFGFIPILFFSSSMPGSVQRAISFLPVNVDSETLDDARASSEWRFQMWDAVWKEAPKYLIIGKGYVIDPNEMYSVNDADRVGMPLSAYEACLVAGDYHSGPLSVLIPFGIFGVMAFLWVLMAGYQVLSRNHRFGDERLRRINSVLLSCYLARCFCFFFLFGALSTDLYLFLGLCGLSVSLNGGVRRKPRPEPERVRASLPQPYAVEGCGMNECVIGNYV